MTGKLVHVEFAASDADRATRFYRQADDKGPIPGTGWFARRQDTKSNSVSLYQSDESAPPPQQ